MTGSPSESPATGTDLRLLAPAAGSWAVTIAGVVGGARAGVIGTVVCVLVGGTACLALRRRPRHDHLGALFLLVVATTGVTAGFGAAITVRDIHVHGHPIAATELVGHKVSVILVVGDDPRVIRGPGPARVRMPVTAALARHPSRRVAATLTAPADGWSDLVPGQRMSSVVTVDRPYRADLTAASLRASAPPRAVSEPSVHQVWASAVRTRFASLSRRALPAAESGLLPGLVLGDVSGLSDDVADDFTSCGLTHLTAVSGANFAILCGTVLLVLEALGVGRRGAVCVAGVVLICFVIVVRPSPSVVRAAVMGAVGLVALLAGRRSQAVPALCAAVIATLGIWPSLAVDPGFALSVCATAALIGVAPALRDHIAALGVPRPAAELLAVALAAQLVTTPLVAMIAGTINPIGVVANLVVALAVAPITIVGTAAAVIGWAYAPVGELLIRFCEPALWWMVHTADILAGVPGGSVSVPDGVPGALWSMVGVAVIAVAWRIVVGRFWHDGRRDRPTPPPPR